MLSFLFKVSIESNFKCPYPIDHFVGCFAKFLHRLFEKIERLVTCYYLREMENNKCQQSHLGKSLI